MKRWLPLLFLCLAFNSIVVLAQGPELAPLQPPRGELRPSFWNQHGWQVVLAAFVVAAIVALGTVLLRRPKPVVVEAPAVSARRALEPLRGRAEDGTLVAEVTRILRRYVMAELYLPTGELTTAEFRETLLSCPLIKPALAAAIGDFLHRCDEWKFAPAPAGPQPGAVAGALALVEKVESERRQIYHQEIVG